MLITTLAAEQDSFVGPMVFGFLFMFVFVPIVVGVVFRSYILVTLHIRLLHIRHSGGLLPAT